MTARCVRNGLLAWDTPVVDGVALASVITSGVVGLTGASAAFYSTHRTAKTAREGRVEQRAADGYLKVLSVAQQEAHWLEAQIYNLGLRRKELSHGVVSGLNVPKPAVTERATAAALVAALASKAVQTTHDAWRDAADGLEMRLTAINFSMMEDGDADANVPVEWMKGPWEDAQPKERAARQALAEAVANELGHR